MWFAVSTVRFRGRGSVWIVSSGAPASSPARLLADLEHGFGDDPATAAETIRLAPVIGLVGGTIVEAARTYREKPIYDLALVTEWVVAAGMARKSGSVRLDPEAIDVAVVAANDDLAIGYSG